MSIQKDKIWTVNCKLVSSNTLQQVEKLKYLPLGWCSPMMEERKKIDTWIAEVNWSVITKQELWNIAKLSVFKLVFVIIFMAIIVGKWLKGWYLYVQADLGFLWWAHGVTLHDKVRSCEIHKSCTTSSNREISAMMVCHVTREAQDKLARQALLSAPTGKQHRVDQGPGGMITFLTFLGPALVWSQQTY